MRRACSGSASDASEDAFTVLHDAFLAGGAFVHVPAGVVVDDPILVLHWCEGDGRASFPHTLVVARRGRARRRCSTGSARPRRDHLVDAVTELLVDDNAHLRYLIGAGARPAHLAPRAASARTSAATRPCAPSAVALGGDYARLRSEALLTGQGAESDQLAVYFGDGDADARLPHAAGPRRAATRAATCCSRARSRTPPARCTRASSACAPTGARRRTRRQTNRNLVLTEGASAESIPNLEIEANDVRCSHASTVGPIDDEQLYYLESRGIPPEEAERLIVLGFFDDVFERLPVGALTRGPAPRRSSTSSSTRGRGVDGNARCACARATTSLPAPPAASTSTATASRSCASATTSTRSATSARTPTTRCPRATCGKTSARSSAPSTARRSR